MITTLLTVDFGSAKKDLSTVGYTLKDSDRSTVGVSQLIPHSGVYGVTVPAFLTPGYILWDTGDSSIFYAIEDINIIMANILFKVVNFGVGKTGLTNVGVTVGEQRVVMPELVAGTGIYGGTIQPPLGFVGQILWDTGENSLHIAYAVDNVNFSYSLLSFFETSSYTIDKVTNQVGILELKN